MVNSRRWFTLAAWSRVMPGIKDAFIRFTLPVICSFATCLFSILALHDVKVISQDFIERLLISLSYGAVALTSLKLFVESKKWSLTRHAVASVAVMVIVVLYAWRVFNESSFSTTAYFALALSLSLLFAPYIKSNSDQSSVWYFNYQTGVALFFAALAALVLGVGIVIILSSLEYLFDMKIPSKIYGDVWILCWGGLFPVYVLANISRQFDYAAESCGFPKGVRFITNYILLPLMLVYMAILYAYVVRITVQWELPRGRLTWMVAGFGSVGIITKLLAYPIRNSGTRLLMWFDKYYYYALIVPIILLVVAIGVRIHDYGITEQRYMVVVMGVWLSSIILLTSYKKEYFHIKYVPMILAALLLLGSWGPWGAVAMSTRSQVNRFEALLTTYQLLHNGQVVKVKMAIPFAARKRLGSIADYLCADEARFSRVRPWFTTLLGEAGKKPTIPCNKLGGSGLVALMGLDYIYPWETQEKQESFSFGINLFQINKSFLDVSGYNYIGRGGFYPYDNNTCQHKLELHSKAKNKTITITRDGEYLLVSTEDGDKVRFDVGGVIRELRKQHITKVTEVDSDKLSLTAVSRRGRFRARLVLEQIDGTVSAQQKLNIDFLRYILMLKFNNSQHV